MARESTSEPEATDPVAVDAGPSEVVRPPNRRRSVLGKFGSAARLLWDVTSAEDPEKVIKERA